MLVLDIVSVVLWLCTHIFNEREHDECCHVTDARRRRLCLAEIRTLLVSWTQTNFGDRAFSAAGSRVGNYLPTDLRQPDLSYHRFM